MGAGQDSTLRKLLIADVARHRQLFGDERPARGVSAWLSMLSPRFLPNVLYRLSYQAQQAGIGPLAKIFSMLNVVIFGIEIATVCKIGPGLFFPHTHGTVIGAVSIGQNAVIYQGVTLGAKDLDFTYDAAHRPVVGDNVMFGAGSKVLGGIVLGNDVVVAANAVVLSSFPEGSVLGGIPAKIIKSRDV
jgi:serine O-acetyltransferase